MKHPARSAVVATLAATVLLGGLVTGATTHSAEASPVQAIPATSLADYLGVNTHLDFGGSYAYLAAVESAVNYLGLKNLRDSAQNPADDQTWAAVSTATGAKFDDYIGEGSPALMQQDLGYLPGVAQEGILNFVEGGNEEDDQYAIDQGNSIETTKEFQTQVWNAGQQLGLPVLNMSFGAGWTADNDWHGDYDKVGDLSGVCNYANAHTYPQPGSTADATIQQLNDDAHLAAASRPVFTSEFGYDTNVWSDDDAASGTVNAALDGLKDGDAYLYYYALFDDSSGNFGLMNADGSPKTPGWALHNLTTLLHDGGGPVTPGSLDYTLSGTQTGDSSLLLEKSDGTYWLALWNESAAAHAVTLTLGSTASRIQQYDPVTAGTSVQQLEYNADTMTVTVPNHPILIEVG